MSRRPTDVVRRAAGGNEREAQVAEADTETWEGDLRDLW